MKLPQIEPYGNGYSYRASVPKPGGGRAQVRRTFGTAQAARAALLVELGDLRPITPGKLTVETLARKWLREITSTHKRGTVANYTNVVDFYIVPHIGNLRGDKLTPEDITALYETLRAHGLAPATIRGVHRRLTAMLGYAVAKKLVKENVTNGVIRPRVPKRRKTIWTLAELQRFVEVAQKDAFWPLWCVVINTGLRRGELAGLTWDDVDLDHGYITPFMQRTTADYEVVEEELKSEASGQAIPIEERAVKALKDLRGEDVVSPVRYVFTRPDGEPFHPQAITRKFQALAAKASLPVIPLHNVRHTIATQMLRNGDNPKIVQEKLRHASIATTMDLYSQVPGDVAREAARRLENSMFRPAS